MEFGQRKDDFMDTNALSEALRYSGFFMEFSAALFDIVLYTFLRLRYKDSTKSSQSFQLLAYYVMQAAVFDVLFNSIIYLYTNMRYEPLMFLYGCKCVYVILVAYRISTYIESVIYEHSHQMLFHKLNNAIVYGTLAILLFYITYCFVTGHRVEDGYFDMPIRFTIAIVIPIYLILYSGFLLIRRRKNLSNLYFIAILISYVFMLSGILLQSYIVNNFKYGFFGTSIGIYILYFTIESPDFKRLLATMEQLQKAEEAAKAANEAKTSFLSNMSHEIRTPINAILGLDEMIIREAKNPEIIRYAMDIQNSGNTLLGLINDVLDFSRIEAGRMDLLEDEYDMSSMLNDLINGAMPRIKEKKLEFHIYADEQIPKTMRGDAQKIKQVILNILTNAIKYTEKGSVDLSVTFEKTDPGHVDLLVSVKDTGIGIKEEDMEKLFQPFERIEEERNKTIEGSGLGLSIVMKLLHIMNSELKVESEYGVGSEFSFVVRQQVLDWEAMGDFTEAYQRSLISGAQYQAMFVAPHANILVVDDTEMNIIVFKGLLKQTQLQIDSADSGEMMLDMVCKKKYDLIFIDHRMPSMDGVEALHIMKTLKRCLNLSTPCVALTANVVQGAKERYLQEGFDAYLSKPIEASRLEALLVQLLPDELVLRPGDEGYVDYTETEDAEEEKGWKEYSNIEGINLEEAQRTCGTEEIWISAVKNFFETVPSLATEIEKFMKAEQWKEFTIKVHALKSSARLIGAIELSEQAAYLEQAGEISDAESIWERAPQTIELLRNYRIWLNDVVKKSSPDEKEKPEISKKELRNAYEAIYEFVSVFDFASADAILKTLENYRIPDDESEKYDMMKARLVNVDRDGTLELLTE